MLVRPADSADFAALREIEAEAGQLFLTVGMPEVARAEVPTVAVLGGWRDAGGLWAALPAAAEPPVGFVAAEVVDGHAHVAQLSVRPSAGRQGAGRLLMERLETWARARQLPRVTLTTFLEVPWNAPYYQRMGYRLMDDGESGPELGRLREREAEAGLDRWPRVAMVKELVPLARTGHGHAR